jgi:hypothetical protein
MRARRFHLGPRPRFSDLLGCRGSAWTLVACAAWLGAVGCGIGGQTGDCSSLSGVGAGGGSQGSQTAEACGVARALGLDAPSEDGFTARAVVDQFAGTYTGTVPAEAIGAAGAGSPSGADSLAGAGGDVGSVDESTAARATSSVEDAGTAEPADVLVTVSYDNGSVAEVICSHQIRVSVEVEVSVGASRKPPASAWLVGDTRTAALTAVLAATSDPDVAALSLALTFDATGASGTLRPADTDAAGSALELRLTRQP